MKVVIVNTSDIQGGAARATYRLHKALLSKKICSKMVVQYKSSDDSTVIGQSSKIGKGISLIRPSFDSIPVSFYKNRTSTLFSPSFLSNSSIVNRINAMKPDIVHLNWICSGMFSAADISKIKAPIVWTLHDMWPFTGGCHYDEDCGGYQFGCGNCKVLGSGIEYDLSRYLFNLKQKNYSKIKDLTLVGVSRWIQKCAQESPLFQGRDVMHIPNPIDTNIYKPVDKLTARKIWNLPQDKKLILFGAMGAINDPRKGFKELIAALKIIKYKDVELVVFGCSIPSSPPNLPFKTHFTGILHDDVTLATLYSACDVMIAPSLQENLSNCIVESFACKLPVVAFNIGGNSDIIDHMTNGYLAIKKDVYDFALGIDSILSSEKYLLMSDAARQKVEEVFDIAPVAKCFVDLYVDLCDK